MKTVRPDTLKVRKTTLVTCVGMLFIAFSVYVAYVNGPSLDSLYATITLCGLGFMFVAAGWLLRKIDDGMKPS
jgi:hypothetical protein